jgi:hypothetical protein
MISEEEYKTAVEAAHIQFAMSLLTPALQDYIRDNMEDSYNLDDKDFSQCCKLIEDDELVRNKFLCLFDDAVDLRNEVSHQDFEPDYQNIQTLEKIASCIGREDLKKLIRGFKVLRS